MRDPARIDRIIERLREVWHASPDMRLGQLLVNVIRPGEPCPCVFYAEDTDTEAKLATYPHTQSVDRDTENEGAMALITTISVITKDRQKVHGATRCDASTFQAEGKTILQLDTYGSEEREFTEKVSQSIQFDEATAAQLLQLIRNTFPNLT